MPGISMGGDGPAGITVPPGIRMIKMCKMNRHCLTGKTRGLYLGESTPYNGKAVEGGPLARLWVSGDYRHGVSTMDRIMARVLETQKVGKLMEGWLEELRPENRCINHLKSPKRQPGWV